MAFSDRMKDILGQAGEKAQDIGTKGFQVSKNLLSKAGAKAQELGERGVLTVEIKQLENQFSKQITRLGAEAYKALVERGEESFGREDAQTILGELAVTREAIEKKEEELQNKKS
ncbi:MAG: hypothetical protein LBQ88_15365 [Treponema sp.]|jgi:hypothetical protein|nr:hypothetical protein [Treponema sp.]